MKNLALSKVYQLLEPGPVVLLTTARKGRADVMTMSWHMMIEFEPPLVARVVNGDYSFAALTATRECVIAIPALHLAQKVVDVGNSSGRDVAKFEKFGLTPRKARHVGAPLVA
jgi:flavin reductase (DIM6/NTAB) family NADH-FMN oxidoreductase RutF